MSSTTQTLAPPSRNLADDGTVAGMLRVVLEKFLAGMDDMMPAQVISYNMGTNQAAVQPLIAIVTTNGEQVPRDPIPSVTVAQFGAGGLVIRFPVKAGDLGWIKATDRDISIFKSIKSMATPNTATKHSFENGVFIPETMLNNVVIAGEDTTSAVLQSFDGTLRIAVGNGSVRITAPNVIMNTTLLTVNGNVDINGTLAVEGDVTGAAGGISLTQHVHGGVEGGTGETSGPIG